MKAKVVIEDGETTIVLTASNEFESDIIEKLYNKRGNFDIVTDFDLTKNYGVSANHNIVMKIKETPKE